jgi:two-component system chemotaxis sensor kinase CheA
VSGRGVGLDVVREVAARLKGEVSVRSEPGRGARFEIAVPVSLSSVTALVVEAAGIAVALPLDAVGSARRLAAGDVARSADGDAIVDDGSSVPLVPLARVLDWPESHASAGAASAVIVRASDRRAAFTIDRLAGIVDLVLRPLPLQVGPSPLCIGASLDADGSPLLVLDPEGLVEAAGTRRDRPPKPPERERARVLVIDDSITTRMLEQSILESAGYEVELATSGEEGLRKAREGRFGLFIVDVEMPGMDGFGFLAEKRADAALRDVPAIMVTSRGDEADRRRGLEAGARAYIVKGEFDQGRLLETIHGLIG